jgi:hypothetical protein
MAIWRSHCTVERMSRWRAWLIGAIKLVHSAIFVVNAASVVHIFLAGLRNRPSRWTRFALVAALSESVVFVVNRGRCPLTSLVEDLGAESGRVSDIFLPRWFADRIPQLCAPLLVVGVTALAFHRWRAHQSQCNTLRTSRNIARSSRASRTRMRAGLAAVATSPSLERAALA